MKWWKLLFPKMMPLSEHIRIVKTLREQIERQKQQMQAMHKEKELILRSTLKQEQRNKEVKDKIKKMEEKLA